MQYEGAFCIPALLKAGMPGAMCDCRPEDVPEKVSYSIPQPVLVLCRYVGMLVPKLKQPEESTTPTWVLIQSRSGEEDEDGNLCWCNKIAYDVLLPLPRASLHGGRVAAESIGLQLLQALGPYRKPGTPHQAPHDCFSLMRCSTQSGSHWLLMERKLLKWCHLQCLPACFYMRCSELYILYLSADASLCVSDFTSSSRLVH